ncbi:hypothetical protein, partial [Streptomyces antimycoticus]|uniref:hypothetical protein n=1 Tax=Streptomyces antimycoticus TaxID=68175 RepID=UPI001F39652E
VMSPQSGAAAFVSDWDDDTLSTLEMLPRLDLSSGDAGDQRAPARRVTAGGGARGTGCGFRVA